MTKRLEILNQQSIDFHNNPPKFNAEERKKYFYITKEITNLISDIRSSVNKVYFVVTYVYFKETGQFYSKAFQRDIDFVVKALKLDSPQLNWMDYKKDSKRNHKKIILSHLDVCEFDSSESGIIAGEIQRLLHEANNPRRTFYSIIDFIRNKAMVIPEYDEIAHLITTMYENKNQKLINIVKNSLTQEGKDKLESLLIKDDSESSGKTKYKLTHTKRFSHSTKLNKVRNNIELHHELFEIYSVIKPVFRELSLSHESVKSFASAVQYRDVFRFKRQNCYDRYLHLIVYVSNQFHRLQDILIRSLISIMKSAIKQAETNAKNEYFKNQRLHSQAIEQLYEERESILLTVQKATQTLEDESLSHEQRVELALKVLKRESKLQAEKDKEISDIKENSHTMSALFLFMKHLDSQSVSITNKCRPILLALTVDFGECEPLIGNLIKRYKQDDGKIDKTYSLKIFQKNHKEFIKTKNTLNTSLYSVLFLNEVSKSIVSGAISFLNSYEYPSLDSLQVPLDIFDNNMTELAEKADMSDFLDFDKLIQKMSLIIDSEFKTVNRRIIENKNSFIHMDADGNMQLSLQRNTSLATINLPAKDRLYPEEDSIPLCEVIATVNAATNFLDEFSHRSVKGLKSRPNNRNFIACLIGKGCHFGTRRFAKLSDEINKETIETVSKEFIFKTNIDNGSDSIIRTLDKLPVAELLKTGQTSSDGQKYTVPNQTLHGDYCFKYGGKEKIIAPYNFVDSRSASFYSLIVEGSRKEAHYMLDGVLNNNVVETEMHSTDTHGFTEAVFCLANLTKINFAPRLKNFQKSGLAAFKTPSSYKRLGYPVLPSFKFNEEFVRENYVKVLRLGISLKLGYTTSEQIFRRLNSYSKHNPLYKALVELGRVSKTIHLLKYMDDPEFRSSIHTQLNKGESLNKLDRALAIGRPDYAEVDKEDQSITETCKRLIKNCLICWNYMYLSQRLLDAKTKKEKQYLISRIKETSVVSWEHFQLYGKFDLSDRRLMDSIGFDISKMFDPSIVDTD